jgi:DNA-binding MarR family transcriptional regulator
MQKNLKRLALMSLVLDELSKEIGIYSLSPLEKRVLLSIAHLSKDDCASAVVIDNVFQHPLSERFARPSIYRGIKSLEKNNLIKKVSRGVYGII